VNTIKAFSLLGWRRASPPKPGRLLRAALGCEVLEGSAQLGRFDAPVVVGVDLVESRSEARKISRHLLASEPGVVDVAGVKAGFDLSLPHGRGDLAIGCFAACLCCWG